ncbi:MAG: mitofilin family membrane protein [Rhodospirillaceae bacterium]
MTPPPARDAGGAKGLIWFMVIIGVAVAAGALTWSKWSKQAREVLPFLKSGTAAAPAADGGLDGRLNALEAAPNVTLKQLEDERLKFRTELGTLIGRIAELETSVKETRGLLKAVEAKAETEAATGSLKALSDRLQALEKNDGQLKDLAARLSSVESTGPAQPGQAAAAGPTVLDQELEKVQAAISGVKARLEKLETAPAPTAPAGGAGQAQAIVLAVAQVRDSLRQGLPLARDLEALRAVAEGRPSIAEAAAKLDPFAASGVATAADLRTRFSALAGSIVSAGGGDGSEWVGRAVDKLSSLVQVRRVGDAAPPGSVDALVASADRMMAAGDIKGAVDAITGLNGKAADVAKAWRVLAEQRLAAEKAVADLHVLAVSLLMSRPARS